MRLNDNTNRDATKNENRLIHKDETGCYSYNDQPIKMGTNTIYYKIFDALFLHHDQNGLLSYKDIEHYLVKNGEEEIDNDEKRNKRINNAIQQLFQICKKSWWGACQKYDPRGEELIEIDRGNGLKFNNPTI